MIFFNRPEARNQLIKYGIVYTIRRERSIGATQAVVGTFKNWKFITHVNVTRVKKIHCPDDLNQYLRQSGFDDTYDWMGAAALGANILYMVEIKNWKGEIKNG